MTKKIMALICICLVFMLSGCGYDLFHPGITDGAQIEQTESEIYSQKEIAAAIRVAERYFRRNFYDCRLLSIRYAGDEKADEMEEWAQKYNVDEVILLVSDFWVPEGGGDGSLGYNQTYTGWNWILTRSKGGIWKHRDHGY